MCAEAIGGAIAATTRTIAKTARLNDGTTVWPARIASPLEVEELGATPLRVRSVVPTGQRAQTSAAPEDNPAAQTIAASCSPAPLSAAAPRALSTTWRSRMR